MLCGIESMSRKGRLLEALRALEAMNGSPDLIASVKRALEELSESNLE